jgi:geranylgeranyl diphosphate synthase type II
VRHVQAPLAVLDLRRQVEDYLEGLVFSHAASTRRLRDAMRYSLLAEGSRVRPVMALATADVLGRSPASVLPLAAAIEMIHVHALMHRDPPRMRSGDEPVGEPTARIVFGADVALLAGDALFAEAIALLVREQDSEPALVLAASALLMQEAGVGGVVGGLYVDRVGTHDLDDDDLRKVYELKTDHLLAAAVGTVLILEGDSSPVAAALRRFGAAAGVLSQIVQDILDATADEQWPRTPRDVEARCSKRTYVQAFGLRRARELARASYAHAIAALAEIPGDPTTLQALTSFVLARAD